MVRWPGARTHDADQPRIAGFSRRSFGGSRFPVDAAERWDWRQAVDKPRDLRWVGFRGDLDQERVDRGAVVGDCGIELLDGTIHLGPALGQPRFEFSTARRDTHLTVEPDALGLDLHPSIDPGDLLIRLVARSAVSFGGLPAERIGTGRAPTLEVLDDSPVSGAHRRPHGMRELRDELVALVDP
ncbi:MAG: hypothetical protein M3R57_10380 [Chloroflexota bacterium]|nr:hypothetical protein [Chloroflexota bacterium]